jgi:hypothetical protein
LTTVLQAGFHNINLALHLRLEVRPALLADMPHEPQDLSFHNGAAVTLQFPDKVVDQLLACTCIRKGSLGDLRV